MISVIVSKNCLIKPEMGLDITFTFGDGGRAYSHMCYSSWNRLFAGYLSPRENRACFQRDGMGTCEDKNICLKVYSMVMVKNYIQDGERLDEYPVKMEFD